MPNQSIRERITVYLFLVVGVYVLCGPLLSSEIDWADDHEAIRLNSILENAPAIDWFDAWLQTIVSEKKFQGRFRPFDHVYRFVRLWFLGDDLFLWSLTGCVVAFLTGVLIYESGRKLGFSVFNSLLMVCLSLVGEQFAVFYRRFPSEQIGSLLFAICGYCGIMLVSSRCPVTLGTFYFFFTLILALTKESFMPTLSLFAMLPILLSSPGEGFHLWKRWFQNLYLCSFTWFLGFIACYFLLGVGIEGPGWAGISWEQSFAYDRLIATFIKYFSPCLVVLYIFIFMMIFVQMVWHNKLHVEESGLMLRICLIFLIAMFPQCFVYARSIVHERYLIPGVFAHSLFVCWLISMVANYRANWEKYLLILSLVGASFLVYSCLEEVSKWKYQRSSFNQLLKYVDKIGKSERSLEFVVDRENLCPEEIATVFALLYAKGKREPADDKILVLSHSQKDGRFQQMYEIVADYYGLEEYPYIDRGSEYLVSFGLIDSIPSYRVFERSAVQIPGSNIKVWRRCQEDIRKHRKTQVVNKLLPENLPKMHAKRSSF